MPSPLRLLHVIGSLSMLRGGPTSVVYGMAKALCRLGISVDIATTDDDGATTRADLPFDRFVEIEGQRIRYFPRQTVKYGVSGPMLRWLHGNIAAYDVVHTHGLFNFAPLAAAWCARSAGVPYLMTPHGVLDPWGMKNKSRVVKATSVRLFEGPLLRSAAAVQFMTELEQARAQLPPSTHSVVLPAGFEFDAANHGDAEGIDCLRLDGRRVILYLARIHPVKCVDILLRAFAGMPEQASTILLIAGDGDPRLVESLKRLGSELGLEGKLQWLGFAGDARKRWLLSQATVFVLPSASENFGMAVIEAMKAGSPVVVTSGCGLADFISKARAGLVTDGTVEGLRSALSKLLADDELRREMGRSGQRAVDRELSLDVLGARLENLYRSILAGGEPCVAAASPAVKS